MQAIEFQPSLKNGQIAIPEGYLELLKRSRKMRVIILIEDDLEEQLAWEKLSAESFLNGYAEADSIYDHV